MVFLNDFYVVFCRVREKFWLLDSMEMLEIVGLLSGLKSEKSAVWGFV